MKLDYDGSTKSLQDKNLVYLFKIGDDGAKPSSAGGAGTGAIPLGLEVKVKLQGLNSAPQYNDTEGVIVQWDTKNERWKVRLEYDGSTK